MILLPAKMARFAGIRGDRKKSPRCNNRKPSIFGEPCRDRIDNLLIKRCVRYFLTSLIYCIFTALMSAYFRNHFLDHNFGHVLSYDLAIQNF